MPSRFASHDLRLDVAEEVVVVKAVRLIRSARVSRSTRGTVVLREATLVTEERSEPSGNAHLHWLRLFMGLRRRLSRIGIRPKSLWRRAN